MKLNRLVTILTALSLSYACAPVIENINISPAIEGEEIMVSTTIKPYLTIVRTPQLGVGFYPPPRGPYEDAGTLTKIADNQYEGSLTAQNYGGYEMELTVPYLQALLPFLRSSTSRYATFYVDGPSTCFAFDGEDVGADGWTIDGVYDGDSNNKVSEPAINLLWLDTNNWPEPMDGAERGDHRGAVGFEIDPMQIPVDSELYEKTFWRVDFRSPPLENRVDWQAMQGVSLRFVSEAQRLFVQPLIKVRKNDSSIIHLRQVDAQGESVFHSIPTESWHMIEFPMQLPEDVAAVLGVEIRLFGSLTDLPFNYDLESFLDGVCVL